MGKAERTRRFIIEKSATLFNKKGYAGTSLSDMTRATGLTKGSIYGNFLNKDELALEAFDHNFEKFRSGIREMMKSEKGSVQKLMCYPRYYEENLEEIVHNGGCPILNTGIEADDTHEALHQKASEAISNWKKSIISIIDIGKFKGEIRSNIDSSAAAELIISLIEGGLFLSKVSGQPSYLHHSLDRIKLLILTELAP